MPTFSIIGIGAFQGVQVDFGRNEKVKAESDAMVTRTGSVYLDAKMEGGLFSGLARRFLTGESLFFQTLSTKTQPGRAVFAPKGPGTIQVLNLNRSQSWSFREGAFLCGTNDVQVSTVSQGLTKGLFSGHGFFVLRVDGPGTVAVNAVGSIISYQLTAMDDLMVDNDHVVGWTTGMQYNIQMQGQSYFSSAASGEGLGCYFRGPGSVLVQTHSPSGLEDARKEKGKQKKSQLLLNNIGVGCCLICCGLFFLVVVVILASAFFNGDFENWNSSNSYTSTGRRNWDNNYRRNL